VRPANRGSKPRLYLVGGSSHPGGGLPLVTTSAKIVAEMIAEDLGR
jgi:phytoene dehydrogenase-like protein